MEKIISRWDFKKRLLLFLKRRKGKEITEKMINDFETLFSNFYNNIKGEDDKIVSEDFIKDYQYLNEAIYAFKSDFIKLDNGNTIRKNDIETFSYYKDGSYKAKINGDLIQISEKDFILFSYLFHANYNYL